MPNVNVISLNPSGADPNHRLGSVELGCFRLEEVIGQGSYGTTYLATQLGFDRHAVVKIAHADLLDISDAEVLRRRFADELRAATRVVHEGLVTLYTAGETAEGLPAIAMELVPGDPLEDLLVAHPRGLPYDIVEPTFTQLGAALAALHAADVVHRGLSPRNVMIDAPPGQPPRVKVLDFGVAMLHGRPWHSESAVGGRRAVMAPEQVIGRAVPASDVFAMGAMLWWALTGQEYRSDAMTLEDLQSLELEGRSQAPDPRALVPDLPAAVASLLGDMLSYSERDRPSAEEFLSIWPRAAAELLRRPRRPAVPPPPPLRSDKRGAAAPTGTRPPPLPAAYAAQSASGASVPPRGRASSPSIEADAVQPRSRARSIPNEVDVAAPSDRTRSTSFDAEPTRPRPSVIDIGGLLPVPDAIVPEPDAARPRRSGDGAKDDDDTQPHRRSGVTSIDAETTKAWNHAEADLLGDPPTYDSLPVTIRDPGSLEAAGPRVLVVDPNPITQHLLVGGLRRHGCRVHGTHDPRVATRSIADTYDLVVLSSEIPDADPLDIARYLQEDHPEQWVVLAGAGTLDAAMREAGVRELVPVPGGFDRLGEIIDLLRGELAMRDAPAPVDRDSVDTTVLDALRADDPVVVQETIELFLGQTPETLARIAESHQRGDCKEVQAECRTLAASARALGANHLARLAQAAAELTQDGDLDHVPGFVAEMEREYGLVFRALMSIHAAT